jgi:hypothetical protein
MSTESTPAIERATHAAAHRAGVGFDALDAPTQDLHRDVTKAGLAAALDVEEMARTMRDADCTGHHHGTSACPDRHCRDGRALVRYRKTAAGLRAAMLGADQ